MKAMMNETLFCDSYAIIELIKGNKEYTKYTDCNLITSEYNLVEVYYYLLRDFDEDTADRYFEEWSNFMINVPLEAIKKGMKIKLEHRKEKLSYVDCIGYAFSLQSDIMFLTGDAKFKNKIGVEFVK
jgi:uncharacterized protein